MSKNTKILLAIIAIAVFLYFRGKKQPTYPTGLEIDPSSEDEGYAGNQAGYDEGYAGNQAGYDTYDPSTAAIKLPIDPTIYHNYKQVDSKIVRRRGDSKIVRRR